MKARLKVKKKKIRAHQKQVKFSTFGFFNFNMFCIVVQKE